MEHRCRAKEPRCLLPPAAGGGERPDIGQTVRQCLQTAALAQPRQVVGEHRRRPGVVAQAAEA